MKFKIVATIFLIVFVFIKPDFTQAQTKEHLDVVTKVFNRLKAENKNYPGPCGGLYITNEVAKELQKQGELDAGILSKPTGNNCIGYSQDIIVYKDGSHYDVLIGGEDLCRKPRWGYVGQVDPARWRDPIDSASIPVGQSGTCGDGGGGGGGGGGGEILIPQIIGANPNNPKPGDKVTIIGANLTDRIQLYNSKGGSPIELTASLNSDETRATITLPDNIPLGDYFVVVISAAGGTPSQNVVFTVSEPTSVSFPQQEIKDFGKLIESIFNWALRLVGTAIFVNFLWAGFLWFTAAGRPGKIKEAQEKMWNSLIGAIILLASYIILNTINPDLVKQTFELPGL